MPNNNKGTVTIVTNGIAIKLAMKPNPLNPLSNIILGSNSPIKIDPYALKKTFKNFFIIGIQL